MKSEKSSKNSSKKSEETPRVVQKKQEVTRPKPQRTGTEKDLQMTLEHYEEVKKKNYLINRAFSAEQAFGAGQEQIRPSYGLETGLIMVSPKKSDEKKIGKKEREIKKEEQKIAKDDKSADTALISKSHQSVSSSVKKETLDFWSWFSFCQGTDGAVNDYSVSFAKSRASSAAISETFLINQGDETAPAAKKITKLDQPEKENDYWAMQVGDASSVETVDVEKIKESCKRQGIPAPTEREMRAPKFNFLKYEIEMTRLRTVQELAFANRLYLEKPEINQLHKRANKRTDKPYKRTTPEKISAEKEKLMKARDAFFK